MLDFAQMGIKVPRILLPKAEALSPVWPVVACDQYTTQRDYWQQVEQTVANRKSTLHLVLPEIYLEEADVQDRIDLILQNMQDYVDNKAFDLLPLGAILVKRTTDTHTVRHGLVVALDLEQYDYSKGSNTLIRPTEGTIVERIPPRLRIRSKAALELPHVIVLINDPQKTVIEPLLSMQAETVYDLELMQNGGHLTGKFIPEEKLAGVERALSALLENETEKDPLLFAVGDGNHSLATAKAHWEQIKQSLTIDEQVDHPARYALVELENIYDPGIVFEPIYRVLFNIDANTLSKLIEILKRNLGEEHVLMDEPCMCQDGFIHRIDYVLSGKHGYLQLYSEKDRLTVGLLQEALDELLQKQKQLSIDYVHGENETIALGEKTGNLSFCFSGISEDSFFEMVKQGGSLPRKTFSMGHAYEKRFYMEARAIR